MRPVAEERSEGGAAAREFRFSAEHFRVISERIYRFSGIRLPEAKHEMVYARLARRLRALGIGSFDDYVRFLELEPAEWEHCTNALTTNVTAFYREEHHFAILAEHARAHGAEDGPYRVWSAGCSTGEEPYTIAMCLSEALPQRAFEVLATDLDTQVIAHAREGVYPLASVQKLSPERQKRHFLRGAGRHEGRARVRREIAAHVEFLRVNLMDREWPVTRGPRRHLLPQRDDLLRQADPGAADRALRGAGEAPWPVLRRPRREPARQRALLPPQGPDGLRAGPARGEGPVIREDDPLRDEIPNRYFDPHFKIETAKILPGEYYATNKDMALVTVLGSCVSACLRDRESGIGGMNHFMLPDEGKLIGRPRQHQRGRALRSARDGAAHQPDPQAGRAARPPGSQGLRRRQRAAGLHAVERGRAERASSSWNT